MKQKRPPGGEPDGSGAQLDGAGRIGGDALGVRPGALGSWVAVGLGSGALELSFFFGFFIWFLYGFWWFFAFNDRLYGFFVWLVRVFLVVSLFFLMFLLVVYRLRFFFKSCQGFFTRGCDGFGEVDAKTRPQK